MVSVASVWVRAWDRLDPEARASISRADGRAPADFFVKALFPTLFVELDASLRSVGAIKRGQCSEVHADAIAAAVERRRVELDDIGTLLRLLRADVAARRLTWTKERDPMARLAAELASERTAAGDGSIDTSVVDLAVKDHYAVHIPDADSVRAALQDDELVARLAAELARKGVYVVDHRCTGECDLDLRLDEFLDADLVDAGGEPTGVDRDDEWAALLAHPCLPAEHRFAHGMGLTGDELPPLPVVRAPQRQRSVRANPSSWHERHRLDSSLEERVAGALRGNRSQRVGLPDEGTLLWEETDRVSAPLGLGSTTSLATLALARRVLLRLPVGDDVRSRVVGGVRARFARWTAEARQVGLYPRLPPSVRNAAEDPDLWYASLLWRRVHGHETRRVQDGSALAAHRALTGIAVTVVDRLRDAPGTLSTTLDDATHRPAATGEGTAFPVPDTEAPAPVPDVDADRRITAVLTSAAWAVGRDALLALVAELFESRRMGEPTEETWAELVAAASDSGHVGDVGPAELAAYLDREA